MADSGTEFPDKPSFRPKDVRTVPKVREISVPNEARRALDRIRDRENWGSIPHGDRLFEELARYVETPSNTREGQDVKAQVLQELSRDEIDILVSLFNDSGLDERSVLGDLVRTLELMRATSSRQLYIDVLRDVDFKAPPAGTITEHDDADVARAKALSWAYLQADNELELRRFHERLKSHLFNRFPHKGSVKFGRLAEQDIPGPAKVYVESFHEAEARKDPPATRLGTAQEEMEGYYQFRLGYLQFGHGGSVPKDLLDAIKPQPAAPVAPTSQAMKDELDLRKKLAIRDIQNATATSSYGRRGTALKTGSQVVSARKLAEITSRFPGITVEFRPENVNTQEEVKKLGLELQHRITAYTRDAKAVTSKAATQQHKGRIAARRFLDDLARHGLAGRGIWQDDEQVVNMRDDELVRRALKVRPLIPGAR